MAPKEAEIIRELDNGLAVAWDTTEISEATRDELRETVEDQVDIFMRLLDDNGDTGSVVLVEAKAQRGRSKNRS